MAANFREPGAAGDSRDNLLREKILELAELYTRSQKKFYIKKFLPLATERLKISPEHTQRLLVQLLKEKKISRVRTLVREYVENLVSKGQIKEGRKVIPGMALRNERRRALFEFIRDNPGVNFSKIKKHVNFGTSTILYHLNLLEEFDIIKVRKFLKRKYYFEAHFPESACLPTIVMNKRNYRAIICLLARNPPMRLAEIRKEVGLHHSTVQYYLKNLVEYGFVNVHTTDAQKHYELTEMATEIVDDLDK
ncbi:MAG: winged helix-turn-helix transcriptional regulator [Promethearchaeota archaeon]